MIHAMVRISADGDAGALVVERLALGHRISRRDGSA
jgi:hypothetical protein